MNKINDLITNGVISIEDVLQFADAYRASMDQSAEDYNNDDEYNPDPEYVVASTSLSAQETFVFPGDESGITSWGEYGGIAERWGDEDWTNHKLAVDTVFGTDKYEHIRVSSTGDKAVHNLYKKRAQ